MGKWFSKYRGTAAALCIGVSLLVPGCGGGGGGIGGGGGATPDVGRINPETPPGALPDVFQVSERYHDTQGGSQGSGIASATYASKRNLVGGSANVTSISGATYRIQGKISVGH